MEMLDQNIGLSSNLDFQLFQKRDVDVQCK